MAAPTVTARIVPTGFKLPDGFKTTIASAIEPGVQFWEQTVKPGGVDGGEKIPTSTMLNNVWRTFDHRSLKTMTDVSGKAGYDPAVLLTILLMINMPGSWTIHHPDNASESFFGYLMKWEPEEREEGKFPLANYTVAVTNYDPIGLVESGPIFTASPGTA